MVSDIQSFGFWVDITSSTPTDWTLKGSVNLLSGSTLSAVSATKYAKRVATENYSGGNSGKKWGLYVARMGVSGLDIGATYGICMSPCSGSVSFATVTTGNVGGAFLQSSPTTGNTDLFISLVSLNLLDLPNSLNNYFDGWLQPDTARNVTAQYGCTYRTTYSQIRVNWNSKVIMSNYYGGSKTTFQGAGSGYGLGWNCPYYYPSPDNATPYGSPSACGYTGYGSIDLRGTPYALDMTNANNIWTSRGWAQSGSYSPTTGSNVQQVSMSISGSCGFLWNPSMYSANYPAYTNNGGPYITLVDVSPALC